MSEDPFKPTETQIEAVLARYTPRQIAVAYLRASRRARDTEIAFDLMGSVADLAIATVGGNIPAADKAVDRAAKIARTSKQVSEGQT